MPQFGKRICVIGNTSSVGKSTLAFKLGQKLNLPVIHLDQLYHYPTGNWVPRPKEEFQALHNEAVAKQEWIIDGKYSDLIAPRFERADIIINIQMNRIGALYRFVRRHYSKNASQIGRIEAPWGKFNWNMVWWILDVHRLRKDVRAKRKQQKELLAMHQHKLIALRSFKEMNDLLSRT